MASVFEYAPAPESRSVVDIAPSYGLFIDGEFTDAADGKVFKTISPSTEEVLSEVARAGAEDVDRAVKAARRAFEKWSALPGSERAKYLFRIARIIQERSRELAVLETLDNGKPIKETRDADLPLVAAHFFYYAGWADKLDHAGYGPDPRPLGVAGQVIPWNFPLLMLAWKIAPALATGNTVVLKPAETTPLSALFFADICRQAGLPKGVVNILPGYGEAGAALVGHPDVDKVAFTGSTAVGKAIARQVAGTDKKVTLELGGKGANIVFDDAPIDQAVEGIVTGIFFNQGQVCCAGSRLLVQESVQDELLDALKRRLSTLRLGDPLDKNTDIGAINSAEQLARITALAETGEAEGAERWSAPCDLPSSGYWFAPTLFTGVTQAHTVAARRDLRPGAVGAVVPYARRGRRQGQQHPVRPVGRHLDGEGVADPRGRRQAPGGCRLGQHVQQVRPDLALRRLQGVGLRPRRRPPRPGGVPRCLIDSLSSRPTSCTSGASSPGARAAGCTR